MRCHPRVSAILHRALSHELGAAEQCVLAAAQANALSLHPLVEEFRSGAHDELRHAELFAARLADCGVAVRLTPAPAPPPGATRDQLLRAALGTEATAVELYERAVRVCDECDDLIAKKLFAQVLAEERQHLRALVEQIDGTAGHATRRTVVAAGSKGRM